VYKHLKAISANKYDLGLATNYKHKIHLKNNHPVYQKQFKIPEVHQNFIEQSLDECCKYFIFSIMSFFGYQSFAQPRVVQTSHRGVTAVHSAKYC
jgi:hypothetical protein